MKLIKTNRLILLISIIAVFALGANAQIDPPPGSNSFDGQDARGNVIARTLGLSDEQKIGIRNINQRQRVHLQEAQQRLQTARVEADAAIYSDSFDEADVEAKVRQVALAQAEIIKIRMMSEVAVRNLLSPEQLVKFRALRERFSQQRRDASERRDQRQRRQLQNDRPQQQPPLNRRQQPPPGDRRDQPPPPTAGRKP